MIAPPSQKSAHQSSNPTTHRDSASTTLGREFVPPSVPVGLALRAHSRPQAGKSSPALAGIDIKIERHRRWEKMITDTVALQAIDTIIADLEVQKFALHPKPKQ
jgi:hypothetical protein